MLINKDDDRAEIYFKKLNGIVKIYKNEFFFEQQRELYKLDHAEYKNAFEMYDRSLRFKFSSYEYILDYKYPGHPNEYVGVFRSITFSFFDFYKTYMYLGNRLYERSPGFWFPFSIFIILYFIIRSIGILTKSDLVKNIQSKEIALNENLMSSKYEYD